MFQYYRLAILVAAGVSIAAAGISGFMLVPMLRRMKFGQPINEYAPLAHRSKQGTPTMGGFMFIFGSCFGLLCAYLVLSGSLQSIQSSGSATLALGLVTSLAFGLIGFIDDFKKIRHKDNLGLFAWQKLLMQGLVAGSFLLGLHFLGRLSTSIHLPFFGIVNLGLFFYPLAFLLIVGMVNAVNLTDGIDGLASSVTMWVMCGYLVLLVIYDQYELSLWATAVAGGCVGFLMWNYYPAKVFMGDTGSLFLGGVVATMGFCMGRPEMVIILGFLYLVEAFSVMIQVSYYKITHGKRIFKKTPIHHHFEEIGWAEPVIVGAFSFVALACAILACIYGYLVK